VFVNRAVRRSSCAIRAARRGAGKLEKVVFARESAPRRGSPCQRTIKTWPEMGAGGRQRKYRERGRRGVVGGSARGPLTAAERQRQQRKRNRDGIIVIPVPCSLELLNALVELVHLPENLGDDRRESGEQIARMLNEMVQAVGKLSRHV